MVNTTLASLRKEINAFSVIGFVTESIITVQLFLAYPAADQRRWLILGIMLVFIITGGDLIGVRWRPNEVQRQLQLIFLTLLTLALLFLQANPNGVIVLYFLLSAFALQVLPQRSGYLWVAVWGLIITSYLLLAVSDPVVGLLIGAGVTCGLLFVGSAANAQRRAEEANAASQQLLAQLQAANQRLQEYAMRIEELAIAQERNRVAREMHDTLGHHLTVAAVQLEGAQRLIARNPAKAERIVETVRRQVNEGLAELRHTVATLRSPIEADLALPTAISRLVANFQEATGIVSQLDQPTELPELPGEVRHALYRGVQEALTNVQRHASAKQAWVTVQIQPALNHLASQTVIYMEVADDGVGIADECIGAGFGLRGLRERAEHLGGDLKVQRRAGGGTQIVLELPLPLVKNRA